MTNLRNYALLLSLAANAATGYLLADGALLKAWKRSRPDYLPPVVYEQAEAAMPQGIKVASKPCDQIAMLAEGRSCQ